MMHLPCYLESFVFFNLQNSVVSIGIGEKAFLSTLNFMISQMVKNECVKFGRHVDKQVNYKILQLKVPNIVISTFTWRSKPINE
jgi:hypothetical protein